MKKKKKNKTKIIIPLTLIIIIILLLLIIFIKKSYDIYKYNNYEIYKVEDRVGYIKDFQKKNTDLYTVNAWIRVQGTNIDEPVIGYLRRNIDDQEVKLDTFAWQPDKHTELVNKETLIGHNILNLSAHPGRGVEYYTDFEDLMGFVYYDFAKDNKYVQYTINGKNYVYKIFSVFFDDTNKFINDQHNADVSKKEMKEMVNRYRKNSYYKYDVDVNEKDKIITLDTCTRFFGAHGYKTFTVHARMLRENEKMNNYSVEETVNYKKIKKKLMEKGEKSDEEI